MKNKWKRLFGILSVVFAVLTFAGAGYVLINRANAGLACIPMVFTVVFLSLYRKNTPEG